MAYGQDAKMQGLFSVYATMLLQIARDYSALPDLRTLGMHEIRFFYEGLRPELIKHTKPREG